MRFLLSKLRIFLFFPIPYLSQPLSCSFRVADIECGLSCLPAAAGSTAEAAAGKAAAPASAEAAAMRAGTRGNRRGGHGSLK